jgi:FkbM family methyltransferase
MNFSLIHCRHGIFALEQGDMISMVMRMYGEWAENSFALIKNFIKPGDTVFDVGANIGTLTIPLAKEVGQRGSVYAYEGQESVFYNLCTNILINNCFQVRARNCLIGHRPGQAQIEKSSARAMEGTFNRGAKSYVSNLINPSGNNTPDQQQIEVSTIDQELQNAKSCHLIKADVEGAEAMVLQGAAETIERHRPILYLECGKPELHAQLLPLLISKKYKVYWHASLHYNPGNYFSSNNLTANFGDMNILCLPEHVELMNDIKQEFNLHPCKGWEQIPEIFPNFVF